LDLAGLVKPAIRYRAAGTPDTIHAARFMSENPAVRDVGEPPLFNVTTIR
jgi:hypothetical protein